MQHPIEICLTAGEWLEDQRGKTAARWARRETENKTIWTFLSQGAAGGAIGYSALLAVVAVASPSDWTFLYFFFLPVVLVFGATWGAVAAILIWLVGLLLKRKLNFVARSLVVTCVLVALSLAQFHLTKGSQTEQWPLWSIVGSFFLVKFPIVLLTGSRIRPCRLLFLGAVPSSSRHNLGSWLSFPAGFLLRLASIFGLLEALMTLALWISNPDLNLSSYAARVHLSAMVLAILYFTASSYFSLWTPRKFFLLPTLILLNVPLASLIVYVASLNTLIAKFLYYPLLAPICLWAAYTLGRLIAPETPARLLAPESARRVAGSWAKETAILKLSPRRDCQVEA